MNSSCLCCEFQFGDDTIRSKYTPATIDKLAVFDSAVILTCSHCGFGAIDSVLSKDILASYYRNDYGGKARKRKSSNLEFPRSKYSFDIRSLSQWLFIAPHVNQSAPLKILEIGAGGGEFLRLLKSQKVNVEYHIVEPQTDIWGLYEKLGGKTYGTIDEVISSFNSNQYFDLLLMSHSLEHFRPQDLVALISMFRDLLRVGGAIFIEVPNADLREYRNAGEMVVPHLCFFSSQSLRILFEKNGFITESTSTCGVLQSSKDHQAELTKLAAQGAFNCELDGNGIWRNTKYHSHRKKLLQRQKLTSRLYGCITLLKLEKVFRKIFNLVTIFRVKPTGTLVCDPLFIYGDGREFIRVLFTRER
jgi:SAM-dependent methyltransferase